jgi:hypothetical protein
MSGQSKKDIAKKKSNLKRRLEEMEKKAKYNILDKNLQAEVAAMRKELAEM